eukprot:5814528-Prymnesium_polylepis.1
MAAESSWFGGFIAGGKLAETLDGVRTAVSKTAADATNVLSNAAADATVKAAEVKAAAAANIAAAAAAAAQVDESYQLEQTVKEFLELAGAAVPDGSGAAELARALRHTGLKLVEAREQAADYRRQL